MKKTLVMIAMVALGLSASAQSNVYFTNEITSESLVKIYQALGVNATRRATISALSSSLIWST